MWSSPYCETQTMQRADRGTEIWLTVANCAVRQISVRGQQAIGPRSVCLNGVVGCLQRHKLLCESNEDILPLKINNRHIVPSLLFLKLYNKRRIENYDVRSCRNSIRFPRAIFLDSKMFTLNNHLQNAGHQCERSRNESFVPKMTYACHSLLCGWGVMSALSERFTILSHVGFLD
ncbi:hypothetical protein Y032_0006g2925 [Ancylostoma ceylanicum]|uniref:Uncharacterized protein n=1 Tax=Ancylostoma ceylanicum TaxID=53326 RepID=A0A016VP21_9BILA|nr:hypothetical protein Y032_0006g2925 [Ancylostoma ceylanicum]